MDVHAATRRWLSPSLFALVGLCFFLPFATVSCGDASTSFTGVQLVTHRVPSGGYISGSSDCSADIGVCVEHAASSTAIVALAAAAIGLWLGLLGVARGPGWLAAGGAIALVSLLLSGGMFGPDIYPHSGYDIALLLFGFLWCLHVGRAWRRANPRSRAQGPLSAHINALLVYGVATLACSILAGEPPGIESSAGSAALTWLVLAVAPTWLVVAVALLRWQRKRTPDLLERAARWDAFLWLGPLLAAAIVRRTPLHEFLLATGSGDDRHASPRKELSCA